MAQDTTCHIGDDSASYAAVVHGDVETLPSEALTEKSFCYHEWQRFV